MRLLLQSGADVNAQGAFGNALHVAALHDHKEIVKLLLQTQGGQYGNALQAESHRGHEVIVRFLLHSGADVTTYGGCCGNALQAALVRHHEMICYVVRCIVSCIRSTLRRIVQ